MIAHPSPWLFFPSKSKQANKDYKALQRDEVGEETGLLATPTPKTSEISEH